jgi:hypothetical protein
MKHDFRSLALALTCAAALGTSACDEEPTTPSNVPGTPVIETFIGTVNVNSAVFYSFTVPRQGDVSLTLVSVTENGQPSEARLGLNIGSPVGTGCSGSVSVVAGIDARPQLTQNSPPGVFCARVSDTGLLSGPVSFALNIARPR